MSFTRQRTYTFDKSFYFSQNNFLLETRRFIWLKHLRSCYEFNFITITNILWKLRLSLTSVRNRFNGQSNKVIFSVNFNCFSDVRLQIRDHD